MAARAKPSIGGQFIAHRVEMLESEAWRSLSFAARKVLDRLEIEHAHHGGKENGRLPCTYQDLARFGVRRSSVSGALRQLVATGFIEVTHQGRGGNADYRDPSRYRLTFLHTKAGSRVIDPTDDWRKWSPILRDIESGHENGPGPVGPKTGPKTPPARPENGSGFRPENGSGFPNRYGRISLAVGPLP